MAGEGVLRIKVVGDTADFQQKMAGLSGQLDKVGQKMTSVGTTLTKGLTLPILGVGVAAFKFASDLDEASSKAKQVYGAASGDIVKASQSMTDAFNQAEFLDIAGTFGALLTNMGFVESEAADLSLAWINLAQDMGSFHNVDPTERCRRSSRPWPASSSR